MELYWKLMWLKLIYFLQISSFKMWCYPLGLIRVRKAHSFILRKPTQKLMSLGLDKWDSLVGATAFKKVTKAGLRYIFNYV